MNDGCLTCVLLFIQSPIQPMGGTTSIYSGFVLLINVSWKQCYRHTQRSVSLLFLSLHKQTKETSHMIAPQSWDEQFCSPTWPLVPLHITKTMGPLHLWGKINSFPCKLYISEVCYRCLLPLCFVEELWVNQLLSVL